MAETGQIELLPIGRVDTGTLRDLDEPLTRRFGRMTSVGGPRPLEPRWYDRDREQYRGDEILNGLIADDTPRGRWRLGLVDADLFAPGLSFIFGQAAVAGCCAIIGLARLRQEFYGGPPNPERFRRRVLTEAVHELGHVAGLGHCPNRGCVMYFSTSIEDTDRKGVDFCPLCHTRLEGGGHRRAAG